MNERQGVLCQALLRSWESDGFEGVFIAAGLGAEPATPVAARRPPMAD